MNLNTWKTKITLSHCNWFDNLLSLFCWKRKFILRPVFCIEKYCLPFKTFNLSLIDSNSCLQATNFESKSRNFGEMYWVDNRWLLRKPKYHIGVHCIVDFSRLMSVDFISAWLQLIFSYHVRRYPLRHFSKYFWIIFCAKDGTAFQSEIPYHSVPTMVTKTLTETNIGTILLPFKKLICEQHRSFLRKHASKTHIRGYPQFKSRLSADPQKGLTPM